jgi:hypothetical protein
MRPAASAFDATMMVALGNSTKKTCWQVCCRFGCSTIIPFALSLLIPNTRGVTAEQRDVARPLAKTADSNERLGARKSDMAYPSAESRTDIESLPERQSMRV